MKRFLIVISILAISMLSFGPPHPDKAKTWVDLKLEAMSLDEQITQLMMIEVRPSLGSKHLNQVREDVANYQVGGLIFFQGDPLEQVRLTNELQAKSKVAMMVGIDGEWGLAMRLSNTTSYPYQMGLGGISDNSIIYEMGKQIGRDCKRMGIHVNFAPVADINNNPSNPVINYRSFGEDKYNVTAKCWAYAKGMQDENVMACAKHFPGHGDTDVDSHKDLPVINHSRKRLDSLELYPFKTLSDSGIMSVMTAHLYIPAIDKTKNSAMSISEKSINGILRDEIGFKGLAFTDALNMQGVAKYHPSGELEVKALEAGNDILLGPVDIPKALEAIKAALESGRISKEYLQEKVRKVLAAKYWAGLHSFKPIQEYGLEQDLNSGYSTFLLNTLIEKQLCLVKNDKQILPIDVSDKLKIATVAIGERWENTFQRTISNYTDATHFVFQSSITTVQADQLKQDLRDYDLVIVGLHGTSKFPRNNYKVTGTASSLVKELNARFNCVFVDFGNPYNLIYFQNLSTVLMGYEDQDVHQMKAAQALFGAVDLDAKLSVSVGRSYPLYSGEYIKHLNIMQFGAPEEVNMRSESLKRIDKIVEKAIEAKATPGCQVLVARYGKVVYQKSYGYHTYTRETAVKNSDLYDIASLTKIMATTLAVMKLVEEKVIKLDDKLSKYLGVLDTTNKKDVTIRQVLTHSSGLKDWIPFYRPTVSSPLAYDTIYHNTEDDKFCVKVDDDLYMCKDYQGVIFGQIYSSEVAGKGDYRYSDLGMILMKYLIEKATHTTFDRYMDSVFYEPMGLKHTAFNPLRRFSKDVIVPTEENSDFRKGLIHGYVHDPAAAMLGGVSGHAGLFANSMDLAVVMQMLLNGGTYNGYRFLTPKTITQFTGYQNKDSRRGLGFDKPEPNSRKVNPVSDYASKLTFGHSGFTGTQIWADPQYGLVYVFLSNRVHPSADNKLLVRMGVRTEVMNVIYESMNHEKLME